MSKNEEQFAFLRFCALVAPKYNSELISVEQWKWIEHVAGQLLREAGTSLATVIQSSLQCPEYPPDAWTNMIRLACTEDIRRIMVTSSHVLCESEILSTLRNIQKLKCMTDDDLIGIIHSIPSTSLKTQASLMYLEQGNFHSFLNLAHSSQLSDLDASAIQKVKSFLNQSSALDHPHEVWKIAQLVGCHALAEDGLLGHVLQLLKTSNFIVPPQDQEKFATVLFRALTQTSRTSEPTDDTLENLWHLLRISVPDQRARFLLYDKVCECAPFDGPIAVVHTSFQKNPCAVARWLLHRAVGMDARNRDRHMDVFLPAIQVKEGSGTIVQDAFSYAVDCLLLESNSSLSQVISRLLHTGFLDLGFFLEPLVECFQESLKHREQIRKVRMGLPDSLAHHLQILQVIVQNAGFGPTRCRKVCTYALGPAALIATKKLADLPKNVVQIREALAASWLREKIETFLVMLLALVELVDFFRDPKTWDPAAVIHHVPFDECCSALSMLLQFASSYPESATDLVQSKVKEQKCSRQLHCALTRWLRGTPNDGVDSIEGLDRDPTVYFSFFELQDVAECTSEYTQALAACKPAPGAATLHEEVRQEKALLQRKWAYFTKVEKKWTHLDIDVFLHEQFWPRLHVSYRDALYCGLIIKFICVSAAETLKIRKTIFSEAMLRVHNTSHQSARNIGALLRVLLEENENILKDLEKNQKIAEQEAIEGMWQKLNENIEKGNILCIVNTAFVVEELRDVLRKDIGLKKKLEETIAKRLTEGNVEAFVRHMHQPWLETIRSILTAGPHTPSSTILLKSSWPNVSKSQLENNSTSDSKKQKRDPSEPGMKSKEVGAEKNPFLKGANSKSLSGGADLRNPSVRNEGQGIHSYAHRGGENMSHPQQGNHPNRSYQMNPGPIANASGHPHTNAAVHNNRTATSGTHQGNTSSHSTHSNYRQPTVDASCTQPGFPDRYSDRDTDRRRDYYDRERRRDAERREYPPPGNEYKREYRRPKS